MKTMHEVAYEFLKQKETATFKQVWDFVLKTLKPSWKETYPNKSVPELEEVKIGELYTMLTIDSEFIKDKSNKWTLSEFHTHNEIQQMKINVSGLED